MYLYLSVFKNSSHLNIIHVAKRVHTFSMWGGVNFGVRNWGGIDAGAQKWGGVVAHTQKWGGDPFVAGGRVFGTFPNHTKPSQITDGSFK